MNFLFIHSELKFLMGVSVSIQSSDNDWLRWKICIPFDSTSRQEIPNQFLHVRIYESKSRSSESAESRFSASTMIAFDPAWLRSVFHL